MKEGLVDETLVIDDEAGKDNTASSDKSMKKEKVVDEVPVVVAKVLPTKSTLIEIRPIQRKSWHGKTGKESFKRPIKLRALVDGETMRYATGLTPKEITALKEEKGINYDLSDNYDADKPHPFWDSSLPIIKLENATMFIDISLPLDYIKYKILKESRFVANSVALYDAGTYPDATHVIFSEIEEAEVLASKIEIENNAVIACSTLSPDKKIQIAMVLGDKNLKGQSASFITVEMNKIIKKDPQEFLRLVNADAAELYCHSLVLNALQQSVLRKDGHRVLYMDSPIGGSSLEAAQYLAKEENQDIKLSILSKIN